MPGFARHESSGREVGSRERWAACRSLDLTSRPLDRPEGPTFNRPGRKAGTGVPLLR